MMHISNNHKEKQTTVSKVRGNKSFL